MPLIWNSTHIWSLFKLLQVGEHVTVHRGRLLVDLLRSEGQSYVQLSLTHWPELCFFFSILCWLTSNRLNNNSFSKQFSGCFGWDCQLEGWTGLQGIFRLHIFNKISLHIFNDIFLRIFKDICLCIFNNICLHICNLQHLVQGWSTWWTRGARGKSKTASSTRQEGEQSL